MPSRSTVTFSSEARLWKGMIPSGTSLWAVETSASGQTLRPAGMDWTSGSFQSAVTSEDQSPAHWAG